MSISISGKFEFEKFLETNSISQQKDYLISHPNEQEHIIEYAKSYLLRKNGNYSGHPICSANVTTCI